MESEDKLWVLIGYRYESRYVYGGYTDGEDEYLEKIALFSSEELARDYIRKSKLKRPSGNNTFRMSSLLSIYDFAEIEEYIPESLPLNPNI